MSLKERSSQAMFSGHSTRSRASWYKPCVSTRLLLESLMTLLLYLRPVGPHQILTNQNFQSPQPTVQTASAFVSWDFVWDIWLVGRTGWRCSWRSSPGEGRTRPAVLSPWPGTVTVCLYQITRSPRLTSSADWLPPARPTNIASLSDTSELTSELTHLVQMSVEQPPPGLLDGGGDVSRQDPGPLDGHFLSDLLVSRQFLSHPPASQTQPRGFSGPNVRLQWVMQAN